MSQSRKDILLRVIAILLFLVIFGFFFQRFIPSPSGKLMSWDAVNTYAPSIETENVTNWHSSFFMYEAIVLKWCLQYFVGAPVSGVHVLYVIFWLFTCLMGGSMVLLLQRLVSESRIWLLFIPVFSVSAYYGMRDISVVGLDYYFLSLLWCEVMVIMLHYHAKIKWKKVVYACLILLILFHLTSYRKNAILFVPVVIGYLMWTSGYIARFLRWQKVLIWCVSVVIFSLLSMKLVDSVLPVRKVHPVTPMMESDVRIASILRGEKSIFWQMDLVQHECGAKVEDVICAYWIGAKPGVEWNHFKEVYMEEWRKNYDTMLTACIIQRVHFYLGDYGHNWMRGIVESRYPAVKNNKKAWGQALTTRGKKFIGSRFVLALSPFVVLIACVMYRRQRIAPYAGSFVIVSGVLSSIYAGSFCIVTPTPDSRYLAPSIMLSLLAILVMVVAIGTEMVKHRTWRIRSHTERKRA